MRLALSASVTFLTCQTRVSRCFGHAIDCAQYRGQRTVSRYNSKRVLIVILRELFFAPCIEKRCILCSGQWNRTGIMQI